MTAAPGSRQALRNASKFKTSGYEEATGIRLALNIVAELKAAVCAEATGGVQAQYTVLGVDVTSDGQLQIAPLLHNPVHFFPLSIPTHAAHLGARV